jgi:molybdopterin converting factor small subunit
MPTIRIPTPLRAYAGGQSQVEVAGDNVGTALADLTESYPELRKHLFDGEQLRSFVNIYLNQEDIRYLEGDETPLENGDTLLIVPSIAGG